MIRSLFILFGILIASPVLASPVVVPLNPELQFERVVVKDKSILVKRSPQSKMILGILDPGEAASVLKDSGNTLLIRKGALEGWIPSASVTRESGWIPPKAAEDSPEDVYDQPEDVTQLRSELRRVKLRVNHLYKEYSPALSEVQTLRRENTQLRHDLESSQSELSAYKKSKIKPAAEAAFEAVSNHGRRVTILGLGEVFLAENGADIVVKTAATSLADLPEKFRLLSRETYLVSEKTGSYAYLIFPKDAFRKQSRSVQ